MQIRFPWILSRRRLLVAVIIDSALFVALHNGTYLYRFGRWPDGSILMSLLWSIWILTSYVLGRYQGIQNLHCRTGFFTNLQGIVKSMFVVLFSLTVVLIYLWLFKTSSGDFLFRDFLIPYLAFLGFFSSLVQDLLGSWFRRRRIEPDHWFFLGPQKAYQQLLYHLQWSRLPAKLKYLNHDQLNELEDVSIVVHDFAAEPVPVLEHLLKLQQSGSSVVSSYDWCESILQRFPSELLSKADLLRGEFSLPKGTFQSRLKRLGDVTMSALLLLLASPILLISCILIKIQDGGPVFYSQIRTGLGGSPYFIYKLRSMRVDAEQNGAQWAKDIDPRITKVGSFLRRTRIDELPQLWCVFAGKMSLIGPRPERPEFDRDLACQIPNYVLRQRMRPGLSGWAQVNYPYGASCEDAANKLSYDLYYLRNFSFWLDLLILFKTIRLVFNAQGSTPMPFSVTHKSSYN